MWELDNKEGRVLKNWYLTVVLEKTLEGPLDSKEIKPVNINGNQTWILAVTKEELKSFLMRVTEESEKDSLKLNIKKTMIAASGPITSWQIEGENVEAVTEFLFLDS